MTCARPANGVIAGRAQLVSVKSAPWSLPSGDNDFAVACDAGQKAIAGGFDMASGTPLVLDTRPSADEGSWILSASWASQPLACQMATTVSSS